MTAKTAFVTGANRGIGFETARQLARRGLRVYLGVRDAAAAQHSLELLASDGLHAQAAMLDVAEESSVQACFAALGEPPDVLVNNAGVYPEGDALGAPSQAFVEALQVNALGALWCARAAMPGMLARGYGRILNLSSGFGAFAEGLEGPAAYSVSKAALNAITVKLAQSARGDVKVNAVDPGWVRTRMGGPQAPRTVEEAAADVVWAATLGAEGPNGCLLRRRSVVGW